MFYKTPRTGKHIEQPRGISPKKFFLNEWDPHYLIRRSNRVNLAFVQKNHSVTELQNFVDSVVHDQRSFEAQ